jgi:multidrug efflux pump subunit AcrA (membrane-fusion protein)
MTTSNCTRLAALAFVLSVMSLAAISGCRDDRSRAEEQESVAIEETNDEGAEDGAHEEAHEVRLSRQEREALGIEVSPAVPGLIDSGTELLGEVRPNADRLAHIAPRFAGVVREVRAKAGDAVRAADVLAIVESSDSLAPYAMTTQIAGVVLERDLAPGEAVDRDKHAFVVADLSTVWVELSVYQEDVARLSLGQAVRIQSVREEPSANGTISYLTPALDRATRTATARVVLSNPDGRFMPGMFVKARALDAVQAKVSVPRTAVQTLSGRPVVFVENDEGFASQPVTLGREGESRVEILSGLSTGERVAATNTFLLKAELAKGEAADDD